MSDAAALAPLLETIADEARRQADQIVAAARQRAEAVDRRTELQAGTIEAQAESRGRAEGEEEGRRRVALARLEGRAALLRERDAQVERVLEEALQRLVARAQGPEAGRFLGELVTGACRELGERQVRVRVRTQDRALLSGPAAPAEVELLLDDQELDEPGALVASLDGGRQLDLTLGATLRRCRDAARRVAASVLFAEDPSP